MVVLVHTIRLLGLMAISALGPGLVIVRGIRWEPLEKLVAATAVSLVVTYLAGFTLFVCHAGAAWYFAISGIFIAMLLSQMQQLWRLLKNRSVQRVLTCQGILFVWLFLLLCQVRYFGGGMWAGDWAEHYQRMQVFLRELPVDYRFLGTFPLSARTPMLNVLAAFYCRQTSGGGSFEKFSLIFCLLNGWAFLPSCLLLRRFGAARRRRFSPGILAGLWILNPFIAENATWTWPKLGCGGFVILGIHFYLRCRKQRGFADPLAAAVALSAGMMIHLMAAPYAVVIAGHCLFTRGWGKRFSAAVAAAIAVAAPWVAWCLWTFGWRVTAGGYVNAPTRPMDMSVWPPLRVAENIFFTLLPRPPVSPSMQGWLAGDAPLSAVHDYLFELMQGNLFLTIGCTGGAIAAWALWNSAGTGRRFWSILVCATLVLECACTTRLEEFGAAMQCQPTALAGLAFLAAVISGRGGLARVAVVVGSTIDFVLGVALHLWMQGQVFTAEIRGGHALIQHDGFNVTAASNWWSKQTMHLVFWGDVFARWQPVLRGLMAAGGIAAVAVVWKCAGLRGRKAA